MIKRQITSLGRSMVALGLCTAVGACGSSTSSGPTTVAATTATSVPATTEGTTPVAMVDGPVPAVAGATDLTKEPSISAGTATAPTVLTGADLVVGSGAAAVATNTVKIQYVGAIYGTGKVFDASWTDSGATSFPLSNVIPGFKDAIIGMKIGGRREVVIPPALGYGSQASAAIPANSTLVFVIDLLGVS